ncbi:MAG TPA: HPr family phosphocarrier protein [Thermohalobaculum sp.]|nr:HPr family phosphocarrier protein [Thermohalobaculum sp.]
MALMRTLTITNVKGLHARASARFVETVEEFDASATVRRDGQTVAGDSIMGLLLLAAAKGTTIDVTTSGPQADALMEALEALVADRFGEEK